MPTILKRDAIAVLGLAALFWWAFMFAKHDPALRGVIPFGEDPYDAVGSYGVIVAMLVAGLSLVRAFRPSRGESPSAAQCTYLVRGHQAVVLAVLITLTADAVAMARHPASWLAAASRGKLGATLVGLAIAAAAVLRAVRSSQLELLGAERVPWRTIATAALSVIGILAVYPERWIDRLGTHLLTVLAGGLVLLVPLRSLVTALVPLASEGRPTPGRWRRWGVAAVVGVAIGAMAFLGEASEGGTSLPIVRRIVVASVFVGLGLAGIVMAYALLGGPLGIGSRRRP